MRTFMSAALGIVGLLGVWGCAAEDTGSSQDPVLSTGSTLVDCNESVVGKKISICHHTGSATNPYVGITIAVKGCIAGHQAQHPLDLNPVNGQCPTCIADDIACIDDAACCSGFCNDYGVCDQPPSCVPTGGGCSGNADCCSLTCCPDDHTCH